MINFQNHCRVSKGYTIVELGVVIVVIGILATITAMSYTGWQKSISIVQVKSDLSGAAAAMESARTFGDIYPSSIPTTFTGSDGVVLEMAMHTDTTFCINGKTSADGYVATNGYYINQDMVSSGPQSGNCFDNFCVDYPGFVAVPGSPTYGTDNFCVMKYEAKNVSGVATSQPSGGLYVAVTQNQSITLSQGACVGCELMTEPQWMTIAQNLLKNPNNWSSGVVGSGYIYSGHRDTSPNNMLEASSDDSDGYYLTGESVPSIGRRTLQLSNGQIIWDISGNAWEWTTGISPSNQHPGVIGTNWMIAIEWNNPSLDQDGLSSLSMPSSIGIDNMSSLTSANGIGILRSIHDYSATIAFARGGCLGMPGAGGILDLYLGYDPNGYGNQNGFRSTVTPAI